MNKPGLFVGRFQGLGSWVRDFFQAGFKPEERNFRKQRWVVLAGVVFLVMFQLWNETAPRVWAAEDRGGELSGEPEALKTQPEAPGMKEPEATIPSQSENARPSLKMPDVVVKGDRQFQVTAERKEWLMLDPMSGTKEIPSDLASVSIPGLDTRKGAPSPLTVGAKNYLAFLEGGLGTSNLREGRIGAGQEFEEINYLLQGSYLAGEYPAAFGVIPSEQKADASFDVRINPMPQTGVTLSLLGQGENQSQLKSPAIWGDWLERGHAGAKFQAETVLGTQTGLQASGEFYSMLERGAPLENGRSSVSGQTYAGNLEYEQGIGHLIQDGLSLWAQVQAHGQRLSVTQASQEQEVSEMLKTLRLMSRFKISTILLMNFGVQLDDFQGQVARNAANFAGSLSLMLPVGSVLYAETHPGLAWRPVTDWMYEQPHPAAFTVPEPEAYQMDCRAGWRQNWWGVMSSDLAWFKKEAQNTPVWTDENLDGLFEYRTLEQTTTEGLEASLEMQYAPWLSQSVKYVLRRVEAGTDAHRPYLPAREAWTELLYTQAHLEMGISYRYLGERFASPGEDSRVLSPMHGLNFHADYEWAPGWNVFTRLDNLMSYAWEEWAGYPQRTFSALLGLRITL